jgi:hypothetical protein
MIVQKENPPQELKTQPNSEGIGLQEIGSRCYYYTLNWTTPSAEPIPSSFEFADCDAIAREGFAMLDAEEARIER